MAKTLDIVVPFDNLGGYFKNSLNSLRQQDTDDFTVWLVDDGSTDGSLRLAQETAAADARFQVVQLPHHEGTSAARNAGVAAGTAPLVTFVDGDDQVAPAFAATLIEGFRAHHADIVSVGYTWGGGWFRRGSTGGRDRWQQISKPDMLDQVTHHGTAVGGYIWNKGFSRAMLTSHGVTYDTSLKIAEDYLYATEAAAAGENFWYNPVVLYTKINRPGSTIHSRTWEMSQQEGDVFTRMAAIRQQALAADAGSASR
ncbi:glycosyltransferase family 2 protein [Schleiferilactobacillus shenzhenensis]|uniref:Glycosyltransferase 2-like domain-containing protein n=1 Tax=Schleiferilactobacillus shenzhenensis LY-73 TaxID=1231336 RepID=U4TMI2_9LACO|nr:glycosyltransferase family 2 protein [Schleiferilactobacillus shenzhenensis]ERL65404.1 hypothetical protein L248_2803 [Schleiferilactobacillus shenzhenensis LY-73]